MKKSNDCESLETDIPMVKSYGAPPQLSDKLIRRLQNAVNTARQDRTPQPKRTINPFPAVVPPSVDESKTDSE